MVFIRQIGHFDWAKLKQHIRIIKTDSSKKSSIKSNSTNKSRSVILMTETAFANVRSKKKFVKVIKSGEDVDVEQ